MGGRAPTSTPQVIVPPQAPLKPSGYNWSQKFYEQFLPQLMGQEFPSYGGQVDPGLSPTLQATMRQAQTYGQQPSSPVLGQAMGGLGSMMGGGAMPGGGQGFQNLMGFAGGGNSMGQQLGNPFGPASDMGVGGRPLGPGMQQIPNWNPQTPPQPGSAAMDRSAMGVASSQGVPPPPGGPQSMLAAMGGGRPQQPGSGGQPPKPQSAVPPGAGGPQSMSGASGGGPTSVSGGIEVPSFEGGDFAPPGPDLRDPDNPLSFLPPVPGTGPGGPGGPGGGTAPGGDGTVPEANFGGGGGPKGPPLPPASQVLGNAPGGMGFKPTFVGYDPGNSTPWMTGPSNASLGGSDWLKSIANNSSGPGGGSPPQSISSPTPQPGGPVTAPFPSPMPPTSMSSPSAGGPQAMLSQMGGSMPGGAGPGGTPGAAGPQDPFGVTGAYDVFRNAAPVMKKNIEDATQQAMASAGATGNRYSSAGFNAAAEAGADAATRSNAELSERLYGLTQSAQDRALQASMGAASLESSGLDRMLRAMGMAPGMAQTEDQLAQNKIRLPFEMGQYEQGRQDLYGRMGYEDFEKNKMGWLPMLSQLAMSAGGGGGGGSPAQVGSITQGGSPGAASYIAALAPIFAAMISDARLKEDVRPLDEALARVRKIPARRFRWKGGTDDIGVIAQEVEAVEPALVREGIGFGPSVKGVSVTGLIGLLLGAVQELATKVEALEA